MSNRSISKSLVSHPTIASSNAAYVAGFFDGEGTLTILRVRRAESRSGFRYAAHMIVGNTNLEVLLDIREMCGNGLVFAASRPKNPNHRVLYSLRFGANQIRHVLPQIMPFLRVKRQQAALLMEFLALVTPGKNPSAEEWQRMEQLRHDIRQLNHRGQAVDTPVDQVFLRAPRPGYRQKNYRASAEVH